MATGPPRPPPAAWPWAAAGGGSPACLGGDITGDAQPGARRPARSQGTATRLLLLRRPRAGARMEPQQGPVVLLQPPPRPQHRAASRHWSYWEPQFGCLLLERGRYQQQNLWAPGVPTPGDLPSVSCRVLGVGPRLSPQWGPTGTVLNGPGDSGGAVGGGLPASPCTMRSVAPAAWRGAGPEGSAGASPCLRGPRGARVTSAPALPAAALPGGTVPPHRAPPGCLLRCCDFRGWRGATQPPGPGVTEGWGGR